MTNPVQLNSSISKESAAVQRIPFIASRACAHAHVSAHRENAAPAAPTAPELDTYVVTLRDVGGAQPADVRLRQWLKLGLRAFGLRCEGIRSNRTHAEASDPGAGDDGIGAGVPCVSVRPTGTAGHRGAAVQAVVVRGTGRHNGGEGMKRA
jgi:hypothetical protein